MLLLDKTQAAIASIPQAVIDVGEREEVFPDDYFPLKDGTYFLRTGLIYGLILTAEGEEVQLATMASVGL